MVRALPPIPQSPLSTSSTVTQVTGRMASPSMSTMVSVNFSIIALFWSASSTPLITLTLTNGMTAPPLWWPAAAIAVDRGERGELVPPRGWLASTDHHRAWSRAACDRNLDIAMVTW